MKRRNREMAWKYDKKRNAYISTRTDFTSPNKTIFGRILSRLICCFTVLFCNNDIITFERLHHAFFKSVKKSELIYYLKNNKRGKK